jgi:hypothetical protein
MTTGNIVPVEGIPRVTLVGESGLPAKKTGVKVIVVGAGKHP